MAFENLVIKKKHTIGELRIDGVIQETTNRTMRLTTNPIESAETISDHVIQEPLQYTMQGVLTDNPLGLGALGFDSTSGSIDNVSGLYSQSDTSGQTRSQQMYNILVNIMNKKDLVEVRTSLSRYDDLIMESINVTQDKDKARAIFFTATFRQALIIAVSSSEVSADNISGDSDKANFGQLKDSGTAPSALQNENSTQIIGGSIQ